LRDKRYVQWVQNGWQANPSPDLVYYDQETHNNVLVPVSQFLEEVEELKEREGVEVGKTYMCNNVECLGIGNFYHVVGFEDDGYTTTAIIKFRMKDSDEVKDARQLLHHLSENCVEVSAI
jgi:hypothetical protein